MFNFKFLEKFENFNEKSGGADYNDDNLGHCLPLGLLQVKIVLDEAAVVVETEVVTVVPQHLHHGNTGGERDVNTMQEKYYSRFVMRGKQKKKIIIFFKKKTEFCVIFDT